MSEAGTCVLRVSNLSIERDETFPLIDVDWEIREGEHWAILGANGSGKTSLLGALTAYIDKSRGEVELLGNVYGRCEWREVRKHLGLVSSAIHKHVWEADSALRIVASGKYAAFGAWSEPNEADLEQAQALLERVQVPNI